MLPSRLRRHAALLCITAAGVTAAAAPAQAQLSGLLPNVGALVTNTGQTLGNLIPGVGGVVTGVTGTVGGVVTGVQNGVTGAVDGTLGNVLGGAGSLLPQGTLDALIGALLGGGGASGLSNSPGGPIVLSGGSIGPGGAILDARAPRPTVRVLSNLRSIGRTGRMRMEVRTNEPGIVALAGTVRPGPAVRRARRGARSSVAHSRRVIKVPSVVLGYRRAGGLTVTVKLSRSAQRALGRSRNARLSAGTIAADLFRNQASDRSRLTIKR